MRPRTKWWRNRCNLGNFGNLGRGSSRSIQLISYSESFYIYVHLHRREFSDLHRCKESSVRVLSKSYQSVRLNFAAVHHKYRESLISSYLFYSVSPDRNLDFRLVFYKLCNLPASYFIFTCLILAKSYFRCFTKEQQSSRYYDLTIFP